MRCNGEVARVVLAVKWAQAGEWAWAMQLVEGAVEVAKSGWRVVASGNKVGPVERRKMGGGNRGLPRLI